MQEIPTKEKQFIKYPATWLNNYGWENDPTDMKNIKKMNFKVFDGVRYYEQSDGSYRTKGGILY